MIRKIRATLFRRNKYKLKKSSPSSPPSPNDTNENKNKKNQKNNNHINNNSIDIEDTSAKNNNNNNSSPSTYNNSITTTITEYNNTEKKKKTKKNFKKVDDINNGKTLDSASSTLSNKKIKIKDLSYLDKFFASGVNEISTTNIQFLENTFINQRSDISNNTSTTSTTTTTTTTSTSTSQYNINNNSSSKMVNNIVNSTSSINAIQTINNKNNNIYIKSNSLSSSGSLSPTSTSLDSSSTYTVSTLSNTEETTLSQTISSLASSINSSTTTINTNNNNSPIDKEKETEIEKEQEFKILDQKLQKEIENIETEIPVSSKINLNSFMSEKQIQQSLNNISPATHVFPLHQTLIGIKIQDLKGNIIEFTSLWENKRVVIAIFRRFGCLICRLQALEISSLKSRLDKLGIPLIGIGFDPTGLEEFIQGKFFAGEIYLDLNRAVYRALNIKRMGFWDSAIGFTDPRLMAYRKKAKEIGMPSNFKGDGMQLGGALVVGPRPQSAHFDFRQQNFTDIFDINQLLEACKLPYPEPDDASKNNNNMYISLPPSINIPEAKQLHFSLGTLNNNKNDNNNDINNNDTNSITSQSIVKSNSLAVDPLGLMPVSQLSSPSLSPRSSSSTSLSTSRSTPDLKISQISNVNSTLVKSPNRYSTFIFDTYYENNITKQTDNDNFNNTTDLNTNTTVTNNNSEFNNINKIDNHLSNNDLIQLNTNEDNQNTSSLVDFFTNRFKIEPISIGGPSIFENPPPVGFYNTSENQKLKIDLESQKLIYNPY